MRPSRIAIRLLRIGRSRVPPIVASASRAPPYGAGPSPLGRNASTNTLVARTRMPPVLSFRQVPSTTISCIGSGSLTSRSAAISTAPSPQVTIAGPAPPARRQADSRIPSVSADTVAPVPSGCRRKEPVSPARSDSVRTRSSSMSTRPSSKAAVASTRSSSASNTSTCVAFSRTVPEGRAGASATVTSYSTAVSRALNPAASARWTVPLPAKRGALTDPVS